MAAKTATPIVLVTVVLLASAFVFAALVMDLPPGVLVTGQPAAVLGIRDYCVCARWESPIISAEPERIRKLVVSL